MGTENIGTPIPGEETPLTETPEVQAVARKLGWDPNHEGGPKLSAVDFILRERTFTEKYRGELKEIKQAVRQIQKHHERTVAAETARHMEELKEAKKAAIREGDEAAVAGIDKEIDDLRSDDTAPAGGGELQEWKDRNSWYDKDEELTEIADKLAVELQDKMPLSEVLEAVDRKVAEHQKAKKSSRRDEPAAVEAGGRRTTGKAEFTFNDLTPEQQRVCDKFVKTIPKFTREKYVADLVSQGVLR